MEKTAGSKVGRGSTSHANRATPIPTPPCAEDYGHLVNERHTERVEKLIKTCGGEVVHGGIEVGPWADRAAPS